MDLDSLFAAEVPRLKAYFAPDICPVRLISFPCSFIYSFTRISTYWLAGAYEITVAISIIDPGNRRPKFIQCNVMYRECCFFPGVAISPFIRTDNGLRVRRVF